MKHLRNILIIGLAVTGFSSCRQNSDEGSNNGLFLIQERDLGAIPQGNDPNAACSFIRNGYFPSDVIAPGTPITITASYETDTKESSSAEAGVAKLVATQDGRAQQTANVTTQLLLCPGRNWNSSDSAACAFQLSGPRGYAALALRVACNQAARPGRATGGVHPGYTSMQTSRVSLNASAGGSSVAYPDVVKVALTSNVSATELYFAKDRGFVAMEFRETSMPAGTAKMYVGGN